LVELTSFLTIGAAQGKSLVLFGNKIDIYATMPWLVSAVALFGGGIWLRFESRAFGRVWDSVTADLKPVRA
jgi:branched-chain amino acid transport system permease protein